MNPTSVCLGCGKEFGVHEELEATCAKLQELKSPAKAVRIAQKRYFKTRSKDDLEAARRAERELDKILEGT